MCLPCGTRYSRISSLLALDDDLLLAADDLAELDDPVDFRNDRRVVRPAGFEQLGHARQTAGDVTRLGDHTRHLDQRVARVHFLTVVHLKLSIGRDTVAGQRLPVALS